MSDDRTSQSEIAQSDAEALIQTEQGDDALVDRTQQLIDEVNQLLGTSDSPSNPAPQATTASSPVAPIAAAPPTVSPALTTPGSNEPKVDLEESAATLKNFLDSLGSESSADETAANETAANVDESNREETPAEVPTPVAAATVDVPQEDDKEESGFDFEALKQAFNEAESPESVAATEASPELPAEPAPTNAAAAAPEAEPVDQPETQASIDIEASHESPAAAAPPNELEKEQDITQKYLEELRSSFNDETGEETENAAERVDVADDEVPEEESEGPSVESWLASNLNEEAAVEETVAEQTAVETTVEAPPIEETVTSPPVAAVEVIAEAADESMGVSGTKSQVLDSIARDTEHVSLEPQTFHDDELAKLHASFNAGLQSLESRIGQMFSAISTQINQLAQNGVAISAAQPPADSGAIQGADGEAVAATADSGETAQPPVGDKIEVLKEQLKSKLREAEIELSINRAKLSQQRASIEQMQADLERREAAVEAKLEQAKKTAASGEKKGGIMDRWKRHLGE